MSNSGELEKVDRALTAIMAALSPSGRVNATRRIAALVRGSNAKRIAAQKDADGKSFAPAKTSKERKPSNETLKFLYPEGGSGAPRLVLLKSWVKRGGIITGYDREAGGIRSFEKAKIIRWLPVQSSERAAASGKLRTRATIKKRIMFRKLRTYARLRAGSDGNEAWVGFEGRTAEIAEVHQMGGMDRPSPKAKMVRYQQRKLLGLSAKDQQDIMAILVSLLPERLD